MRGSLSRSVDLASMEEDPKGANRSLIFIAIPESGSRSATRAAASSSAPTRRGDDPGRAPRSPCARLRVARAHRVARLRSRSVRRLRLKDQIERLAGGLADHVGADVEPRTGRDEDIDLPAERRLEDPSRILALTAGPVASRPEAKDRSVRCGRAVRLLQVQAQTTALDTGEDDADRRSVVCEDPRRVVALEVPHEIIRRDARSVDPHVTDRARLPRPRDHESTVLVGLDGFAQCPETTVVALCAGGLLLRPQTGDAHLHTRNRLALRVDDLARDLERRGLARMQRDVEVLLTVDNVDLEPLAQLIRLARAERDAVASRGQLVDPVRPIVCGAARMRASAAPVRSLVPLEVDRHATDRRSPFVDDSTDESAAADRLRLFRLTLSIQRERTRSPPASSSVTRTGSLRSLSSLRAVTYPRFSAVNVRQPATSRTPMSAATCNHSAARIVAGSSANASDNAAASSPADARSSGRSTCFSAMSLAASRRWRTSRRRTKSSAMFVTIRVSHASAAAVRRASNSR